MPRRSEALGRCVWLMLMTLTLVGLVLLYLEFSFAAGRFWTGLAMNGDKPSARKLHAMAYCDSVDVFVSFGGRVQGSGEISNGLFLYDFGKSSFTKLPSDGIDGRYGAVVVNVAPDEADSEQYPCRFLIHGGVADVDEIKEEASDSRVWSVEISNDKDSARISEVAIEGMPVPGRYLARGIGFGDSLIMHGGKTNLSSTSPVGNSIWRLRLNSTSFPYRGTWTEFESNVLPERFDFASTRITGSSWLIHGGRARDVDSDIALSSMYDLKLNTIADLEEDGDVDASVTLVEQGRSFFRWGHVAGAWRNRIFTYGGSRIIEPADDIEDVSLSNYVLLTTFLDERVLCQVGRVQYSWCGFLSQFPGKAEFVEGVNRRDSLLVVMRLNGDEMKLNQLDMELVELRGGKVDARDIEADGVLSSLITLQYALIATCIFLIMSLFILYRNRDRNGGQGFMVTVNVKTRGISKRRIRSLPLLRYDADGNHVYVNRVLDGDGNETYEETDPPAFFEPPKDDSSEEEQKQEDHKGNVDDNGKGLESNNFLTEEDEGEVCAICLLPFEQEEVLRQLPCRHMYHEECVDPWLSKKGNCPLCKRHVVTGRQEEDKPATQQELEDPQVLQEQDEDEDEEVERRDASNERSERDEDVYDPDPRVPSSFYRSFMLGVFGPSWDRAYVDRYFREHPNTVSVSLTGEGNSSQDRPARRLTPEEMI